MDGGYAASCLSSGAVDRGPVLSSAKQKSFPLPTSLSSPVSLSYSDQLPMTLADEDDDDDVWTKRRNGQRQFGGIVRRESCYHMRMCFRQGMQLIAEQGYLS